MVVVSYQRQIPSFSGFLATFASFRWGDAILASQPEIEIFTGRELLSVNPRRYLMRRIVLLALFASLLPFLAAAPASAQATRTWVSGVGDDANPCSRTAPCKTFAGAISKTADGGEIDALDPGGFGAVTITKSITIDGCCMVGILAAGTTGVNFNDSGSGAPNTKIARLR